MRWKRLQFRYGRGIEPTDAEKLEFIQALFFSGRGICSECGGIFKHTPTCIALQIANHEFIERLRAASEPTDDN